MAVRNTSWGEPCAERRVLSRHWSRSDAQCNLWHWQRRQKKQWQTGYSPRPPTLPYCSQFLRTAWPPVCSSIHQVSLKSVQWFCHCGWSKIAHSHYFGHWFMHIYSLYIACTTVQAVINGTLQTVIYCTPLNQAPHTGVSVLLIMQSRTICQKFEMTYVLATKLPE